MSTDVGPVYRKGTAYGARAEARQREYRARVLSVAYDEYGHLLAKEAADRGSNFVVAEAFDAARARQISGKGVDSRTFANMLSSQAMCFNIFAPLASRLDLATNVLKRFFPGLHHVTAIEIEHTPASDVFNDQSGRGGVDCDLLVQGLTTTGEQLVRVVETKFVEPEFSNCGFRGAGRKKKGLEVCPDDVAVRDDRRTCLYARKKGYRYWSRNDEHAVLADGAVPQVGCPFGGPRWQLWVNLVLAHVEAERRAAADVGFAVCASSKNRALLRDGAVLGGFRSLLRRPESVELIELDGLLECIARSAPAELAAWVDALFARYHGI